MFNVKTPSSKVTMDSIVFGLQKFGGISNYWAQLLNYICNEDSINTELILPKKIKFNNFNVNRIQKLNTKTEILNSSLSRYTKSKCAKKSDIFHSSYYRLPVNKPNKIITTVYDFTYERYRKGLPQFIHSFQKNKAICASDAILCISNSTKKDLLNYLPGVDPSIVHVVPLGVDKNVFYVDKNLNNSYQNNDIINTVLFVGQRNGYKRFDLAISAIKKCPDLILGIVGPKLTNLEKENLCNNLGNRWQEYGPVENERLRYLYSLSFALIFPSDYEGFGLPILEAMACGCPVIAAHKSSFPEVGGDAALYADYQDGENYSEKLMQLYISDKRNLLIKLGFEQYKLYTWENTIQMTMHHYKL